MEKEDDSFFDEVITKRCSFFDWLLGKKNFPEEVPKEVPKKRDFSHIPKEFSESKKLEILRNDRRKECARQAGLPENATWEDIASTQTGNTRE